MQNKSVRSNIFVKISSWVRELHVLLDSERQIELEQVTN